MTSISPAYTSLAPWTAKECQVLARAESCLHSIAIGTAQFVDAIRKGIRDSLEPLAAQGYPVKIEEKRRGGLTFFSCTFGPGGAAVPDADHWRREGLRRLATAVADVLVDQWENHLLVRLVQNQYSYFSPHEQAEIVQDATQILDHEPASIPTGIRKHERKARILQEILSYFEQNQELVLEGFLVFRLRDYVEGLVQVVDDAVDEYLLEREYKEFIRLLKFFVQAQEPKVEKIHAIMLPDGGFQLVDEENHRLDEDFLRDVVLGIRDRQKIRAEDLLLSALITLAPRFVVLHAMPGAALDSDTASTLREVFGPQLLVCHGCALCDPDHHWQ